MNHSEADLARLQHFVRRTFNGIDLMFFISSLKNTYTHHQGLETVFSKGIIHQNMYNAIHHLRKVFFSIGEPSRTEKHISDSLKNSAAK